jgi:hypothetical protein
MKPATLATTRLAEYWAHGLDITDPLGIDFPDTGRLRHIAWLAHRTLPYALSRAGEGPAAVRCSLTAPDEVTTWTFGPDEADSEITGSAGAFCHLARTRRPGPFGIKIFVPPNGPRRLISRQLTLRPRPTSTADRAGLRLAAYRDGEAVAARPAPLRSVGS